MTRAPAGIEAHAQMAGGACAMQGRRTRRRLVAAIRCRRCAACHRLRWDRAQPPQCRAPKRQRLWHPARRQQRVQIAARRPQAAAAERAGRTHGQGAADAHRQRRPRWGAHRIAALRHGLRVPARAALSSLVAASRPAAVTAGARAARRRAIAAGAAARSSAGRAAGTLQAATNEILYGANLRPAAQAAPARLSAASTEQRRHRSWGHKRDSPGAVPSAQVPCNPPSEGLNRTQEPNPSRQMKMHPRTGRT